jgi:hypothetical protein
MVPLVTLVIRVQLLTHVMLLKLLLDLIPVVSIIVGFTPKRVRCTTQPSYNILLNTRREFTLQAEHVVARVASPC